MLFAIKAEISNPRAETFVFIAQKTMYCGKHIAKGDTIFVFASENEGGPGLIASGVATSAKAIARKRGIARQTPRVSITIRRTALAKRPRGGARHDLQELRVRSDLPDQVEDSASAGLEIDYGADPAVVHDRPCRSGISVRRRDSPEESSTRASTSVTPLSSST